MTPGFVSQSELFAENKILIVDKRLVSLVKEDSRTNHRQLVIPDAVIHRATEQVNQSPKVSPLHSKIKNKCVSSVVLV